MYILTDCIYGYFTLINRLWSYTKNWSNCFTLLGSINRQHAPKYGTQLPPLLLATNKSYLLTKSISKSWLVGCGVCYRSVKAECVHMHCMRGVRCYPVHICASGLCVWSCRVSLCIQAVWGFATGKSSISVIYCLLVKFNG